MSEESANDLGFFKNPFSEAVETLTILKPRKYEFTPKEDITAHELAVIIASLGITYTSGPTDSIALKSYCRHFTPQA